MARWSAAPAWMWNPFPRLSAMTAKMKLALGSDHAGFRLKAHLLSWLRSPQGGRHRVADVGCENLDSCDYPDFAVAVGRQVQRGRAARGILICGTGIGMGMAANKLSGVRAAVTWNP